VTDAQNETAHDLVIYGSPVSPFARKAMAVCMEKGVAFDFEAVNIMPMPDWFKEISPMRRIPVLRDRSVSEEGEAGTIADSSAMCAYIERKHPETPLYGTTAYGHGRALMIEEYSDTTLAMAGGLGIFRPIFFNLPSTAWLFEWPDQRQRILRRRYTIHRRYRRHNLHDAGRNGRRYAA